MCNYLYHYTNLDGLCGILKSKHLRFSSCRNYKDADAEAEAIKKILEETLPHCEHFKSSIKNFVLNDQNKQYQDDLSLIEEVMNIRANSYIASFSKINNNRELWKKYADNGNGVVLGFDQKYIIPSKISITTSDSEGRLTEYRYVDSMYYEKMNL